MGVVTKQRKDLKIHSSLYGLMTILTNNTRPTKSLVRTGKHIRVAIKSLQCKELTARPFVQSYMYTLGKPGPPLAPGRLVVLSLLRDRLLLAGHA